MNKHFALVISFLLATACSDPARSPLPDSPAPVDSAPVEEPERPSEPKRELPSGRVVPAQVACENSLTVNGIAAVGGGAYVTVDELPRTLVIEVVDCPHPEAVVRGNYVRTGYGTGEVRVRANPVHNFNDSVVLANQGGEVFSGRFVITDTTGRLQKAITKPTGFPLPTGVATEPVVVRWIISVRGQGGSVPAELHISQLNSEIRDNGRIGTRALVIREAR